MITNSSTDAIARPVLEARDLTAHRLQFAHGIPMIKQLLAPTSLTIHAGELVAIMGPSGAGKSTLLRLLSGHARGWSGNVTLRNLPEYCFRDPGSAVGHLHQDDILHEELSVENSLHLTARIRHPELPKHVRCRRLQEAIEATRISPHVKKRLDELSGGERRRANLCAELLSKPLFLFLDEPTANLDPYHSKLLIQLARSLADAGHGVTIVTHDVASQVLYDKVAFLNKGHLVFFGTVPEALERFSVDSLAEIYDQLESADIVTTDTSTSAGPDFSQNITAPNPIALPSDTHSSSDEATDQEDLSSSQSLKLWDLWNNSARITARQVLNLFVREARLVVADWPSVAFLLLQPLVGAFLTMGLADSRSLVQPIHFDLGAKQTLFTMALIAAMMGLISSHREIVRERVIFRQEYMAGLRNVPYVVSKLMFFILIATLQTALLFGLVTQKLELPDKALIGSSGLGLLIGLLLCAAANVALGLFISSLAWTSLSATTLLVPALTAELALGGLLFELKGRFFDLAHAIPTFWAYRALGTAIDVNRFSPYLNQEDSMFTFTRLHLVESWGMLVAILLGLLLATLLVFEIRSWFWKPYHMRLIKQWE